MALFSKMPYLNFIRMKRLKWNTKSTILDGNFKSKSRKIEKQKYWFSMVDLKPNFPCVTVQIDLFDGKGHCDKQTPNKCAMVVTRKFQGYTNVEQ